MKSEQKLKAETAQLSKSEQIMKMIEYELEKAEAEFQYQKNSGAFSEDRWSRSCGRLLVVEVIASRAKRIMEEE
ncbi:MAG: hypothetical protein QGI80_02810 [archaeon]|jgi:hypothetical protein|nr:hypothetical protein [archaeon]